MAGYYMNYGNQQKHRKNTPLFQILWRFIFQPRETIFDESFSLGQGLIVLSWLVLITILQKAVLLYFSSGLDGFSSVIWWSLIEVPLIWVGLSWVYHLAALWLGGVGSYTDVLAVMGYASFPVTLTTLLSAVLAVILFIVFPDSNVQTWDLLFNLIGAAGLLWGWVGWLGYAILRWVEGLSSNRSLIMLAVFILIFLGGSFLSI